MKSIVMSVILTLLLTFAIAVAAENLLEPQTCKQCSVDRKTYAQSRMLIVYADGTSIGACSLHCAAAELQNNSKKLGTFILVADYNTRELIDARTAVWVLGGKKKGVMTALPKWAFAKKEDALQFIREYGGTLNTFEQAMKAATLEVLEHLVEEKEVEKEIIRVMQ
jgi:copper chaperone NosL